MTSNFDSVSKEGVLFCKWYSFHVPLPILILLRQQVERLNDFLSLVEKPRQYHEQEETPEMMAARIDRDVVGLPFIFRSLAFSFVLFFKGEKISTGKMKLI